MLEIRYGMKSNVGCFKPTFYTLGRTMGKPELLEFEDDALCEKMFRERAVLKERAAVCRTNKSLAEACPKTCNTELLKDLH